MSLSSPPSRTSWNGPKWPRWLSKRQSVSALPSNSDKKFYDIELGLHSVELAQISREHNKKAIKEELRKEEQEAKSDQLVTWVHRCQCFGPCAVCCGTWCACGSITSIVVVAVLAILLIGVIIIAIKILPSLIPLITKAIFKK